MNEPDLRHMPKPGALVDTHLPTPEYGYEWIKESSDWRTPQLQERDRSCRRLLVDHQPCPGQVVIALRRAFRASGQWWFYCADHSYGRVVREGAVYGQRRIK